jgi:putative flippase GtrA
VGAVNTIFGYAVFAILILLNLHYTLAALLSQICGALFNFQTTGNFVFKNRSPRLIFRFLGVYLATYLLTIGLLKIFNIYGVNNLIAGAIIVLPMALVSFILNKKLVFRTLNR